MLFTMQTSLFLQCINQHYCLFESFIQNVLGYTVQALLPAYLVNLMLKFFYANYFTKIYRKKILSLSSTHACTCTVHFQISMSCSSVLSNRNGLFVWCNILWFQAILTRKLNVPEVMELIKKVEDMSITADSPHVRRECRQVIHRVLKD
jgi:hypothetical protein